MKEGVAIDISMVTNTQQQKDDSYNENKISNSTSHSNKATTTTTIPAAKDVNNVFLLLVQEWGVGVHEGLDTGSIWVAGSPVQSSLLLNVHS